MRRWIVNCWIMYHEITQPKVIEVFGAMNIAITMSDIEDCHRLVKSSKNTTVLFVNKSNAMRF